MSDSHSPRRRHSPAVYRRRRIVLLVAVIAVVALVWLLIAQPWSGSAAPEEKPTTTPAADTTIKPADETAGPTVSPSATTAPVAKTPEPSASGPQQCKASNLEVEPVTDRDEYTSKQKPKLSIALTNTGKQDCTFNVGTSTQKLVISSGGDTWWRSTDCQSAPADQVVLLAAGQKVTSATPLEWDRTRSSVKTCNSTDRPKAPGGGASYHLSVEIGGVASEGTKQFLLY